MNNGGIERDIIADLMRKVERLESTPSTFLTTEEIAVLTGRKSKSRQIAALRRMGVAFLVNDIGHPVVARSVIEGTKPTAAEKPKWVPRVLSTG